MTTGPLPTPPLPMPHPPPSPAHRPRAAVMLLSLLVVLALGAAGTMAALWNDARDDRATAAGSLAEATAEVGTARQKLSDTRRDVQETTGKISTLESENATLHLCGDPAKDSIIAARDGNKPALSAAVARVEVACK